MAPDEEVNATFSIDKSRKEESVLVLSVEKGVLFWNEIVAGDELLLVGGIPANSFASVVELEAFIAKKRFPLLKLLFFRDKNAGDGGFEEVPLSFGCSMPP